MNREEIYDHLAQVYLGKRKKGSEQKRKQFNIWLLVNVLITFVIFVTSIYGLSAFLAKRESLDSLIIHSLHHGVVRVAYDFKNNRQPFTSFDIQIPSIQMDQFSHLEFAMRGKEEGVPGVVKVMMKNKRQEQAAYYIQGVDSDWQKFRIALEDFKEISDWNSVHELSFVLESWNVDQKKGLLVVDDIHLSTVN